MFFKSCIITDIKRAFNRYEFFAAVAGVCMSLIFSLEHRGVRNGDTLFTLAMASDLTGALIAFVFCAVPFAAVFCEDLENRYVYYQLSRVNKKIYVFSKLMVIYLSSVLTMILGTALFVGWCRIQVPWVNAGTGADEIFLSGYYGKLVEQGHYFLYCILLAMHRGFLAGILSVAAALLSLYISNRVMVLVLPVCVYQILVEFNMGNRFLAVSVFRTYSTRLFKYDWQCVIYLLMLSGIFVGISGILIYRRLVNRI